MKILFCDVDGTLTETLSGKKFKQHSRDIKILHGAGEAIAHYQKQGWLIIGTSNQGGVGAGYKTLNDTFDEMRYTLSLFPGIEAIYFCPDMRGKELCSVTKDSNHKKSIKRFAPYRKPAPGMINYCLSHYAPKEETIPKNNCWMVGDRPEDKQAANNAGINFIWADIWRSRFITEVFELNLEPKEMEFLEGGITARPFLSGNQS